MITEPSVRELIERALLRELSARRGLKPHVQLSIPPDASPALVERAYATLRAHYDPAAYGEYGAVAVDAAHEIGELLRVARELMLQPPSNDQFAPPELTALQQEPGDETRRALETLRGAIDRRLRSATEHRQAGRIGEAASVLESVLLLDRRNARAQAELHQLRALMKPVKHAGALTRVFDRLWQRLRDGIRAITAYSRRRNCKKRSYWRDG